MYILCVRKLFLDGLLVKRAFQGDSGKAGFRGILVKRVFLNLEHS